MSKEEMSSPLQEAPQLHKSIVAKLREGSRSSDLAVTISFIKKEFQK